LVVVMAGMKVAAMVVMMAVPKVEMSECCINMYMIYSCILMNMYIFRYIAASICTFIYLCIYIYIYAYRCICTYEHTWALSSVDLLAL
jgi:hypothetical protein